MFAMKYGSKLLPSWEFHKDAMSSKDKSALSGQGVTTQNVEGGAVGAHSPILR